MDLRCWYCMEDRRLQGGHVLPEDAIPVQKAVVVHLGTSMCRFHYQRLGDGMDRAEGFH